MEGLEGVPIVDPGRLTLILSNPTKPRVISNLTPVKIYGLILKFTNFTIFC